MTSLLSLVLVCVLGIDIFLLATGKIKSAIKAVALQGVLISTLPLITDIGVFGFVHALIFASASAFIKGHILPQMLNRALEHAKIPTDIEAYVGYNLSLFIGLCGLGASWWLTSRLSLPDMNDPKLLAMVAIFSVIIGLFVIVARMKAISQVLGYLVFENGIYMFGVAAAPKQHLLIELAILLDMLVAVFLMGIIMFHIQREFDHIDTDQLSKLHDAIAPTADDHSLEERGRP
jgi:hydrogenase-4 component E